MFKYERLKKVILWGKTIILVKEFYLIGIQSRTYRRFARDPQVLEIQVKTIKSSMIWKKSVRPRCNTSVNLECR